MWKLRQGWRDQAACPIGARDAFFLYFTGHRALGQPLNANEYSFFEKAVTTKDGVLSYGSTRDKSSCSLSKLDGCGRNSFKTLSHSEIWGWNTFQPQISEFKGVFH